MKLFVFPFLLFFLLVSTFTQDTKILVKQIDINKNIELQIPIINNQIVFSKPQQSITIIGFKDSPKVTLFSSGKLYPFDFLNSVLTLITPTENKTLTLYSESLNFKFYIVTGFLDKDTTDGWVNFEDQQYYIGYYPPIPNKGKINYFKESYSLPKYFFLWSNQFEELPISSLLLYKDLVINPDPIEGQKEPPERPTKIFTLSYETILNFEKVIMLAKMKSTFKRVKILSFYRTPDYNKKIRGSTYSRHIYGDGIDWFVDENPQDNIMDDLNNNKKIDPEDAKSFIDAVIELVTGRHIPPCGTGVYFTQKGASLHYDSRGHLARWGHSDDWWPENNLPDWLKDVETKVKEKYEK